MQQRLDEGEDRAVHVVDGGGGEEQGADEPADVGFFRGGGEARIKQAGSVGGHAVEAPGDVLV